MALTVAPFGGYLTPTFFGNNDKARIVVLVAQLKNLIPNPDADPGTATTYAPDFDEISPQVAKKLRKELDAMSAAIAAAPTADIGT